MRFRNPLTLGLAVWLTAAACGGESGTEPDDDLPVGTIVARIDGSDWITSNAIAIMANGRLVATGRGNQNLTLGFGVTAQSAGTYTTGGAGNASGIVSGANNTVWESTATGGSGTITITSVSGTEVSGTFSFTVVRTSGSSAPPTRTVANGRFRVRY